MEKEQKLLPGHTAEDLNPEVLIKKETERLPEDVHAPDLANLELPVNLRPLQSIKTEGLSCTDTEASTLHGFTPVPQTHEYIKTELMLDEELRDEMNDLETTCATISTKESGTCHLTARRNSPKRLQKDGKALKTSEKTFLNMFSLERHMKTHTKSNMQAFSCQMCGLYFTGKGNLTKHLNNTHGPQTAGDDSIKTKPEEFFADELESVTSALQPAETQQDRERSSDVKSECCQRKGNVNVHLDKTQSTCLDPQIVHNDSIYSKREQFSDEDAASHSQESQQSVLHVQVGASDLASETCEVCNSVYPREIISTHMCVAHSNFKYKCEFCSHSFKTKPYLKMHLRTHHPTDTKWACDLCERTFPTRHSLGSHKKVHKKLPTKFNVSSAFKCEVCGINFTQKGNLKVHMLRKHLDKAEGRRTVDEGSISSRTEEFLDEVALQGKVGQSDTENETCEVCHKIFAKELIRTHIRLAHCKKPSKYEGRFECRLCSRPFRNKYDLKMHLNTHATDRKREFACDLCERSFYNKSSLGRHKKDHSDEAFACEVCGLRFTQRRELKTHMVRQHLDKVQQTISGPQAVDDANAQAEKTTFECRICSQSFETEVILNMHLSTHTQDRKLEFACKACGRTFHSQSSLWKHTKVHNRDTPHCKVCGKHFTRTENLKLHMLSKHMVEARQAISDPQTADGDSMNSNQILNNTQMEKAEFESGICSQYFETEPSLNMHLSTHAQDKKLEFACKACGRAFHSQSSLWKHMKVHNRGAYHCRVCEKQFTRKENLKLHIFRCKHFVRAQQLQPRTPKDGTVPTKTELISDKEFVDYGNDGESVSHAEKTEKPTLAVSDERLARVGIAEDSAICEVCLNSYPAKFIEKHMLITHGIQRFECPFCPRVCLRKSNFRKHMRTHDENHTRPYACEQCGSKFPAELYLKRHIITQHGKNIKPEFNCEQCGKKFFSKVGCELHIKTHTAETVSCGVCGVRFIRKQTLKKHMRRKHKNNTQRVTPDPQTANDNSLQIKEEFVSDEEFLDEETCTTSKFVECRNDS